MKKEENVTVVYKPEENKLVVPGILSAYRFGGSKYSGDKEIYQISIKTTALTPGLVAQIKKAYFSDTKDKYLPSFIKDFEDDKAKDGVYINLKSQYEIPAFVEGEGNKRYSFDDVIELGEGLPPCGSTVKLSCRLKEGAIYPLAILIQELRKQDASDYFD